MSERTTKKMTAPSGAEFEMKDFINARERNALRAVFLEDVRIEAGAEPKLGDLSGALLEKAELKLIELTVTSYAGSAENVTQRILDGTPEDYDFIVKEANRIGNFKPAK